MNNCPELLQHELEDRVKASNLSSDVKRAFCIVFELLEVPTSVVKIIPEAVYDLETGAAILIQEAAERIAVAPTTIPTTTQIPLGAVPFLGDSLVSQEVVVEMYTTVAPTTKPTTTQVTAGAEAAELPDSLISQEVVVGKLSTRVPIATVPPLMEDNLEVQLSAVLRDLGPKTIGPTREPTIAPTPGPTQPLSKVVEEVAKIFPPEIQTEMCIRAIFSN